MMMVCHIASMCVYYSFGNSISLASVDFSGSFVGLTDYNQWIVGPVTMLLWRVGPYLFDYLLSVSFIVDFTLPKKEVTSTQIKSVVQQMVVTYATLQFQTQAVYSTVMIFVRGHRNLYTTFAPKLIFTCAWTINVIVASLLWLLPTAWW
jgi:hypothetical protein